MLLNGGGAVVTRGASVTGRIVAGRRGSRRCVVRNTGHHDRDRFPVSPLREDGHDHEIRGDLGSAVPGTAAACRRPAGYTRRATYVGLCADRGGASATGGEAEAEGPKPRPR